MYTFFYQKYLLVCHYFQVLQNIYDFYYLHAQHFSYLDQINNYVLYIQFILQLPYTNKFSIFILFILTIYLSLHFASMAEQIMRTTSFRNHRKHGSNILDKNLDSVIKTRYNQSFGDLFLKKNKDRLAHFKQASYFKQASGQSFINSEKLQYREGSPVLNHTMSMPDKVKSISQMQKKFMNNSANKSSYRSKIFNVDVTKTQLPKLRTNSSSNINFNSFSHSKLQSLNYLIVQTNQETLQLSLQTKETSALVKRIFQQLQKQGNQLQKSLKTKIKKLQKLVQETKQQNHKRKINTQSEISILQMSGKAIKMNLDKIQQKINIIQHSIGYSTGHHKHFV